ncbi:hypothetical protein KKH23_01275 [Patescibacteria group bacterium]|nr:hypothetical protein [Patescibacteria group bacterium]MBU0777123.1 hypothetical protein [Patescibacteria group bacterium]MBU0845817.1 hypothetical protein [Patescibacteria group bacterium]MBU0922844.1 hypothetical protein [Patescibacteria group bacterium]MBU1066423.1 hypothetical protein [Patescibacteria group bacterium]
MNPERLSRLSIVDKPKFWLENSEKDTREYGKDYGDFAYAVIKELGNGDPDFPKDVVIVGANWTLIVEGDERSKVNRIIWHIENRFVPKLDDDGDIGKIDGILEQIQDGIDKYELVPRMAEKIAILDVAGAGYPIFDEDDTEFIEKRVWGWVVKHPSYPTKIYHITHGYKTRGKDFQSPDDLIQTKLPSWLNSLEGDSISDVIGRHSLATINELRLREADMPLEGLSVGDNWKQLIMGRVKPKNEEEREDLKEHPSIVFVENGQLEAREKQENFSALYSKLYVQVDKREITETKTLPRIAILDRASNSCPIFSEEEIDVIEIRSWGRIIKPKGHNVLVYHITEDLDMNYQRKIT